MSTIRFIASGCSFTFEKWCWPTTVANYFKWELNNVGMASQGNGLIGKKAIYHTKKLLDNGTPAENIVVGIMWSGADRHSIYIENTKQRTNIDGWIKNPTSITGNDDDSHWLILNGGWRTKEAVNYYGNFYNHTGSFIRTLEYILLTQWFLKEHKIKYFMDGFMDIFNIFGKGILNDPDVKHLYEMIDFDKFVGDSGQYEWVRDNCGEGPECFGDDVMHPTPESHEKYANEVIIPHLQNNNFKHGSTRKLL